MHNNYKRTTVQTPGTIRKKTAQKQKIKEKLHN
jgi:hypothetical protein